MRLPSMEKAMQRGMSVLKYSDGLSIRELPKADMIACSKRGNDGAITVHGEVFVMITIAFPDITNQLPGR